jgi:hypothetical protein
LNGLGHDGYWRGFNTILYNDLINNNSVVLLSNRGESLDLDEFWEKLSALIEIHAMTPDAPSRPPVMSTH